jgi:cobalt/nickel transport system permease protein
MRPQQQGLPQWLEESRIPAPPAETLKGRRRRQGFMAKTLHGIAELMRNEVFSESLASRPGLLQRMDPRAKVLTVLLLIGAAGLIHHIFFLVCLNLWLFWLARVSQVPIRTFIKRVWIVVPLFTGIVVFPVLFNVVQPGTPLVVLFHLPHPLHLGFLSIPAQIAITRQGATAALLLVLRVGASVSLAVLLTLTTRWQALLKALRVLRIPVVFLMVLEMTYRYIFLLLQTSSEMFMARQSRMVGRASSREERGFVTSAMGQLWARTHATSEEVHNAMRSRGYTGEPRTLFSLQLKSSDWLWGLIVLMVAVLLVGGDRILG